jgi:hypothetical protein
VSPRVDLVIDPLRHERVPIELPLQFRVPVERVRAELGLPDSVDLSDPIVAKAVALAGAAKRFDPPVRFALFGGTAHRVRCPSSNSSDLGLRHELHDMDLGILQKEAKPFQRFLATVGQHEGSGLTFFETPGDRIFNSTSDGRRLRWHSVVAQDGSEVVLGTLDIVADDFEFCHRIDIREDVEKAPDRGWTFSPTHLLLAKAQFIQRIPKADGPLVGDRVLEPFGKREYVIGPEPKDVRDLLAVLHDHPFEDVPEGISPREVARLLGSDWGLWKTVGLNLDMVARSSILSGLQAEAKERIEERLTQLRGLVGSLAPKRRLSFLGGAWWQEVDSVPSTDTTVATSGPA